MTEQDAENPRLPDPPRTGNAVIDQALAELVGLQESDVAGHHDRLAAAQDVLTGVLETSRNAVQTPIPGVLRPRPSQDDPGARRHG
ncbi:MULTISPECIES: hypothetical protein [unclassified Luteococcus]|uniref:hypothetical protein n=1 Tax=unclassified Luteococcus TaxID=2639923 RepID=UPI00313D726F